MDIGKEFLETILELGVPNLVKEHDQTFTDKPLTLVRPPAFHTHELHGLDGLVMLASHLHEPGERELMAVVLGHEAVVVRLAQYDDYNDSPALIKAMRLATEAFPFGRYLPAEEFCIALLTKFVGENEVQALYRLASRLTASSVYTSEDDGISQRTTIQKGVATRAEVQIKPVWLLQPFRTFPEVAQPATPFLFRLKQDKDQVPQCALFETDGGKWKLEAIKAIEGYLREKLGPEFLIVA